MRRANVIELKVPEEPLSMTILEWHVREGESVLADQPLVDLVSPECLTTLRADTVGRVSEILLDEGALADPGQTIATILA